MARARSGLWLFLVALLALLAVRPAGAVSPSFLMVYGGSLKQPVIIKLDLSVNTTFIWDSVFRKPTGQPGGKLQISELAPKLSGRAFFSVAIFWGPWGIEAQGFRGESARPPVPADSLGAGRDGDDAADMQPVPHPIPDRARGFTAAGR